MSIVPWRGPEGMPRRLFSHFDSAENWNSSWSVLSVISLLVLLKKFIRAFFDLSLVAARRKVSIL